MIKRVLTGLLLGTSLWVLPAVSDVPMPVSFSSVLELKARKPDLVKRYGNAPSQTAALWMPPLRAEGPVPVIFLVHGGCWLSDYSAEHIYPLAAQLAADGYAVWVPEYRRVGEPGGGWPGSAVDMTLALDALADVNNPRLALSRTVVMGHSAGGHLGLWLAARDPSLIKPPVRIVAAVGLAAITDLKAYSLGTNSCEAVTTSFMGGAADEVSEAYLQASPASLPSHVPVRLLRGTDDGIVGPQQMSAMRSASTMELPQAGHFDWVHPETAAYDRVLDAVFDVLGVSIQPMRPVTPAKTPSQELAPL
ncbi:alpha/beta hydrolase family protein [Congregibacter sp.]|uniref:alpha/beta hydrolase family protein n=1 Tax=Congregibacter sp. TaxID=2744308 RepID=UPI003F6D5F2F